MQRASPALPLLWPRQRLSNLTSLPSHKRTAPVDGPSPSAASPDAEDPGGPQADSAKKAPKLDLVLGRGQPDPGQVGQEASQR
ncbi:conserved hypothetical protein [Verticillium alfalfae VaMs.102]|uniref:Uncharacterized protein n=1 Tax=Verticillium alfalfae (strain VaMs.102 / ATCC MYA-4576 / FGSC 10136) TaxID=526221 RepID=C9SCW8_VERA1|nr:conserved hypothetical protein [Verticillium alfalfae VaMs.102]EEY16933.1 conserved hypothetical protein [Verticillium alfalfae VaMs.102]